MIQSRIFCRGAPREIVHDHFGEGVNVGGRRAVRFDACLAGRAVGRGGRGIDDARLVGWAKFSSGENFPRCRAPAGIDRAGRVGDRGEMENRVESFVAELLAPIERRQICRDEIAPVAARFLKSPERKSSITVRRASGNFSCRARTRFEPMKPAPPVTRRLRWESGENTSERVRWINKS